MIGPDSSFILLKNGLPKITFVAVASSSPTYGGNTINFQNGGNVYFKPQTNDIKVTVSANTAYSCTLYRSTTNSNYSSLYSFPGSASTYSGTLTSSYYYYLSSYHRSAYFKNTAGSATQFVK